MSEASEKQSSTQTKNESQWPKRMLPLFGVTGALVTMVLLYFSYDYVSAKASPCESIFRQTAVGLSTKISFLKTEGEVQIGREPLIDLTERAQMTALNLKTCCTVLDAGKLDPEQFLQCKAKARAYEARVGEIVTLVQKAPVGKQATKNDGNSAAMSNSAAASPNPVPSQAKAKAQIEKTVIAARKISKEFNNEVVKVRKAQAVEQLEIVPPMHVDVSAKEREPNNDNLNTNIVEIDKLVTAAIADGGDRDVFSFTTPEKYRDWIKIEVENRSTTLRPKIVLFNADKAKLGERYNTTAGGNASYSFVSGPQTRYSFQIGDYYGERAGAYLVRVIVSKSYDAHEPNGTILTAKRISSGEPVKAAIMDGRDVDYYRLEAGNTAKQLEVKLANQSTTLRPKLMIFDGNKTKLGERYNTTGGGDVGYVQKIKPGMTYYVYVSDYYGEVAGNYEMTVKVSE